MVKTLRDLGLECEMLIGRKQVPNVFYGHQANDMPQWVNIIETIPRSFYSKAIYILKASYQIRNYDFIHSRCLGALRLFTKTPYVEQTVGSDMRELAVVNNSLGKAVLRHYRNAKKIIISQTDHVKICKQLDLENYTYLPLVADTDNYYPDDNKIHFGNYDLTIFHPSHLDWTYTYGDRTVAKGNNKTFRNSTKGNDKLVKAVARLIKSGRNVLLIMLERGIDVQETKTLVDELGIQENVLWLAEMDNLGLRKYYSSVDVVADQFDCGSLGLIAYDAMVCGAPVIGFLEEATAQLCYNSLPSILNCRSEDDIYMKLLNSSKYQLNRVGQEGKEWVINNHSPGKIARTLLRIYNELGVSESAQKITPSINSCK